MSQISSMSPIEEIIEFFSRAPSRDEIAVFHLSSTAQDYVRELLRKNSTGALTREESRELDKLVVLNDVVSLIRVRAQRTKNNRTSASSALTSA